MDGIKPFNWSENVSKVTAGLKGGRIFDNPNLSPPMRIVDGTPEGVDAKLMVKEAPTAKIIDSWNQRR